MPAMRLRRPLRILRPELALERASPDAIQLGRQEDAHLAMARAIAAATLA